MSRVFGSLDECATFIGKVGFRGGTERALQDMIAASLGTADYVYGREMALANGTDRPDFLLPGVLLIECKIEGGTWPLILRLGTVAQIAALTHGKGADVLMDDCEFCWAANCVRLMNSDYGALTQARFLDCKFHNFTASAFEEADGSGGSAAVRFRNLEIGRCTFDDNEGGAAPTKYLSLDDDNGNDGIVHDCSFPTAINSGLNLVSTALHWVSNRHTGGISTGVPS